MTWPTPKFDVRVGDNGLEFHLRFIHIRVDSNGFSHLLMSGFFTADLWRKSSGSEIDWKAISYKGRNRKNTLDAFAIFDNVRFKPVYKLMVCFHN